MKHILQRTLAVLGLGLVGFLGFAQSPQVQNLYQQAHAAQQAGETSKAIDIYRELLHQDPSIAPAYNNLGRLYFSLNRFSEAAEVLRKGLQLNPEMAPAQVMLGASYLQMGQADKALEPLRTGVQGLPGDRFARQTFARALLQTHHNEEAAEQLHKLVEIDPKDQRSWYLLGKVELQLSEDDFAHMRSIDPDSALSHQLSAEIMQDMQNKPGAIEQYKKALEIDPNDLDALLQLADLYLDSSDLAKAEPAYRQVLQKRPGDCHAEWKLASIISQTGGDNGEALSLASSAVKACPDIPQAHVERARAYLRDGKAADAMADLKLAEAKSPDEPSIQFLLAKAYRSLGDETKSKQAMARFEELDKMEHAAQEKRSADVLSANQ